jgi:hypothetical protein
MFIANLCRVTMPAIKSIFQTDSFNLIIPSFNFVKRSRSISSLVIIFMLIHKCTTIQIMIILTKNF